jgi:hypothetical protein
MRHRVIVTVGARHLGQVDRVARDLRQAGMTVDQVLSASGIITGTVEPHRAAGLDGVAGVDSVEPDTDARIPPPDADVR